MRRAAPDVLEEVVLSLLAKGANDRPASAHELERRLAACDDVGGWTAHRVNEGWKARAPEIAQSSSEFASSVLSLSR